MDRGQEQPPLWAVVTVGCCVTSIAIPPPWQISLDWGKAPRMSLPQVTEVGCKSVKLHQSHQYSRLQCKVLTVIRCRGPVERVVGCSQTETRPNSCRVAKLKDQPSNRWNSENSNNKAQRGRVGRWVEQQTSRVAWPCTHIKIPFLNEEYFPLRCQVSGSKLFEMHLNPLWELDLP